MKYTTQLDKVSYCLGLSFASNLINEGVKTINVEAFTEALSNTFAGNMPDVEPDEANKILTEFFEKLQNEKGSAASDKGKKFLEENAKNDGVKTLPSGLQYKVLNEGNGKKPTASQQVKCHYEGRLIDGTVFDSSYRRGEPAIFPVNGVISGWVEALQMMTVGSKWQLFIPSELAYGSRGAGNAIGPNETLIFDVELLDIV